MANTNRDLINSAMGGSQDPNQDDYQQAMGGGQYGGGTTTPTPTPPASLDSNLSMPTLSTASSNPDGSAPNLNAALQPDYGVGDTVRVYRRDKAGTLIQTYTNTIDLAEATDASAGTSGKASFGLSTIPAGTWRYTCDVLKAGGATYGPLSNQLVIGPDDIEPVLTAPITPTGVASAQMTVGCTTDTGEGTLYAVLTTNNAAPSPSQVEGGQSSTGAAANAASLPITSIGAKTLTVATLSASTTYYIWYMHKDAAGNRSAVLNGGSQATAAPGSFAKLAIGSGSTGASGDRSQYIDSTDGFTATGNADTSAPNLIKSPNTPPSKFRFEVTMNAWNSGGGRIHMGVTDSTRDVGPAVFTMPGKSGEGAGATFYALASTNILNYSFNGATGNVTLTDAVVVGSVLSFEVDSASGTIIVKHKPPSGSVQTINTYTLTSQVPTNYRPFVGSYKSVDSCTVNFGASAWAITPTSGYAGY